MGGIGIFFFAVLTIFKIGFSIVVSKNFSFSVLVFMQFAYFPFFSIWFSVFVKNSNRFSDLISMWLWFFLFGFRFLLDLSGNYGPLLIWNSCKTSVCSTCHHCCGSIRVLTTGM